MMRNEITNDPFTVNRWPRQRAAAVALAAIVLTAAAATARADRLDLKLLQEAPEMVHKLQSKGYQNVGVLPFQLQKGRSPARYGTAPINGNMAARLETALVMSLDPAKPLGVIHKAGTVAAARSPQTHWSDASASERASLFEADYLLRWGGKHVKADAFLLGRVRLSEDMRKATVLVACFDRKNNRVEELVKFDVPTDRTMLADAGQSFVLSRSLVKKRSLQARDESSLEVLMDDDAADSAKNRDEHPTAGPSGGANEYLDFEVRYDDQVQTISGDPAEGGELRITAPRTGQAVEFRIKNKTPDKIGVVVFVNGKSTLEMMTDPADKCRPWVLPPDGTAYGIRGYVDDKDVLTPFKIVAKDDDLVKNELADKLGLIEVFVLTAGPSNLVGDKMVISDDSKDATSELAISRGLSLRPVSPATRKKLGLAAPRTAAEARDLAYKSVGMKVPAKPPTSKKRSLGDGGYMVPDPQLREQLTIPVLDLPNRVLVSTPIIIRYNDRLGN